MIFTQSSSTPIFGDFVDALAFGSELAHIIGNQRIVDKLRNSVVSATEMRKAILLTRHGHHLSATVCRQCG